ncbi:MAG: metal-dependent transcriptional regulator [Gaiellaceae bacterium]
MPRADLSESIQDYLKAIYELEQASGRATTSAIAEEMRVSPPSATSMLKKLAALGLVEHEPYRGAVLTDKGERAAIEVIRHHRLIELYLAETLGLPLDELHAEADRLEHALSERLEARIDASLGFPTHDPHGDPIPSAALQLEVAEAGLRTLASLDPGEEAVVKRVPDRDPELLRYLASVSLVPGNHVRVCSSSGGSVLVIAAGGGEHTVSREIAGVVGVG